MGWQPGADRPNGLGIWGHGCLGPYPASYGPLGKPGMGCIGITFSRQEAPNSYDQMLLGMPITYTDPYEQALLGMNV